MLAGANEARVTARHTAMLQGEMRDGRSNRPVRLGDISTKGMLVVCERPPSRGDFVDVLVNGHELTCQVRWVNGRRFGVRSSERINVEAILAGRAPNKRIAGKKIEPDNDPDGWPLRKLIAAYLLLGVTAFATAYLLVTYFVL